MHFINFSSCCTTIFIDANTFVQCNSNFHTEGIKPLRLQSTILFCRYSYNYKDSILKKSIKIYHTVLGQIINENSKEVYK